MIIYIWGDNGASMEGTETGSFNEMTTLNGVPLTPQQHHADRRLRRHPCLGRPPHAAPLRLRLGLGRQHPFQWGKQVASHLGGTRDPMVVSWPATIKDKGGLRTQFTHVIDVAPTILEAAGIPVPREVNGIAQMPMHGMSFAYTFDDAGGQEPAHPAILRDFRQPGDVQGRLDRLRSA